MTGAAGPITSGLHEPFAKPFHEQALNTLLLRFVDTARSA